MLGSKSYDVEKMNGKRLLRFTVRCLAPILGLLVAGLAQYAWCTKGAKYRKAVRKYKLVVGAHIEKECMRLGIEKPHVVYGPVLYKNAAAYCLGNYLVHIDPRSKLDPRNILRHELRHAWQWEYRFDAFIWFQENFRVSKGLYWVNPIESDARYYELNSKNSGLLDTPIEIFERMHRQGILIESLQRANVILGVDKQTYMRARS